MSARLTWRPGICRREKAGADSRGSHACSLRRRAGGARRRGARARLRAGGARDWGRAASPLQWLRRPAAFQNRWPTATTASGCRATPPAPAGSRPQASREPVRKPGAERRRLGRRRGKSRKRLLRQQDPARTGEGGVRGMRPRGREPAARAARAPETSAAFHVLTPSLGRPANITQPRVHK